MELNCPFCGQTIVIDQELAAGQRIQCPYCAQKFVYNAPSRITLPNDIQRSANPRNGGSYHHSNAEQDARRQSPVKNNWWEHILDAARKVANKKYSLWEFLVYATIALALLLIGTYLIAEKYPTVGKAIGFFLLLILFAIILIIIFDLATLAWRVNRRALNSIFDALCELGEPDFNPLTRKIIILILFALGISSLGVLFLLEALIVVVRANKLRCGTSAPSD